MDAGMDESAQDNDTDIFVDAESAIKLKLPLSLKNILKINGYDSPAVLASITEKNIDEIEHFARTELCEIVEEEEWKNYFGQFSKHPALFRILSGHRNAIFLIRDYFKRQIGTDSLCSEPASKDELKRKSVTNFGTPRTQKTKCSTTETTLDESLPPRDTDSDTDSLQQSARLDSPNSFNAQEENAFILRNIKKWAKNKVTEVKWQQMKTDFDNIDVNTRLNIEDNCIYSSLTCFCKANYKICKVGRKQNSSKRWIYSNFQTHLLKKHLDSTKDSQMKSLVKSKPNDAKLRNQSIMSFMSLLPASSSQTNDATSNATSRNKNSESYHLGQETLPNETPTEAPVEMTRETPLETPSMTPKINILQEIIIPPSTSALLSTPSASALASTPSTSALLIPSSTNVLLSTPSSSALTSTPSTSALLIPSSTNVLLSTPSTSALLSPPSTNALASTPSTRQSFNEVLKQTVDVDSGNYSGYARDSVMSYDESTKQIIPSGKRSKWTADKYQRTQRVKRAREKMFADKKDNQSLITQYFSLTEKITIVLREHPELIQSIDEGLKTTFQAADDTFSFCKEGKNDSLPELLKKLAEIALQNMKRPNNKNTFDEATKKFSLYLFYVGGRLLYETLYANLNKSLPSISTMNRYLDENRTLLREGEFDFLGLNEYINGRNLPKKVWISEDGTRISGKIEYDPKSNKIVGFVLPLRKGFPEKNTYMATSARVIESFFDKGEKANYAYVVMAQPLNPDAPAFCLSIFGTNNRFTGQDVTERWGQMKEQAAGYGIEIVGFSSDGDPRLLRAMRLKTSLNTSSGDQGELKTGESQSQKIGTNADFERNVQPWEWFQFNVDQTNECFIQDTVHIITKLRTRLLKPNIILPLGNNKATVDHLKQLIDTVSKDKHMLNQSDLKPEDKMNFSSAQKMCSSMVTSNLQMIPDSDGTKAYLKIMHTVLTSFLEPSLRLDERLHHIWYAVFFLRIWRSWIKNHVEYCVKENFLTDNCYLCIELNAHGLIKIINRLKNNELESTMFTPSNFSSQACESLFRTARSMTSTYSTVVNFSIKDLLHRIDRIKTVNHVVHDLKDKFQFPRERKRAAEKLKMHHIITEQEIHDLDIKLVVEEALNAALIDTVNLGLSGNMTIGNYSPWNILDIPLKSQAAPGKRNKEDHEADSINDEQDRDIDDETSQSDNAIGNVHSRIVKDLVFHPNENTEAKTDIHKRNAKLLLKDYSDKIASQNIDLESSPYVRIEMDDCDPIVIRKSSYCWLLDESGGKVSADRLRRFIVKKGDSNKKREGPLKANRKRIRREEISTSDSTSSSGADEKGICDDSTDTEHFSSDASDEGFGVNRGQNRGDDVNIIINNFYAIFYDNKWYLGCVTQVHKDSSTATIKYLKLERNMYVWPRREDVDVIHTSFIFHGPITLIGNGPYALKRCDSLSINKKYDMFKTELKQ